MEDDDYKRRHKVELIDSILSEDDLYAVVGASRTSTRQDIKRSYHARSRVIHPDKPPPLPNDTLAFQRLHFSYAILHDPSTRRAYDRASSQTPHPSAYPWTSAEIKENVLASTSDLRSLLNTLYNEFVDGNFHTVRSWLQRANRRYPHWFSRNTVRTIDRSVVRTRKVVLGACTYTRLGYAELARIAKVLKRYQSLEYTDVVGGVRLTAHLVKVILAVPIRIDRKLKAGEESRQRARTAGLHAAGREQVQQSAETTNRVGILGRRVSKVLEYIVGDAKNDDAWEDVDARTESESS